MSGHTHTMAHMWTSEDVFVELVLSCLYVDYIQGLWSWFSPYMWITGFGFSHQGKSLYPGAISFAVVPESPVYVHVCTRMW